MSEDPKFTENYKLMETQEAFHVFGDALGKFRDALYEQLEPIMKKMAELLDKIT